MSPTALASRSSGKVYLIPSSIKAGEIARILREGYDVGLLDDGFKDLVDQLKLDILLIDTHPGLNEETLLSIAISDVLAVILRPDEQDYQGTSVTIEVARKLDVPDLFVIVNKVPQSLNLDASAPAGGAGLQLRGGGGAAPFRRDDALGQRGPVYDKVS